ncbi:MAG: DJ-1/PfpI family protein [Candidatus Aenigmatarchaeota archaeon]|nr:DJ-1/PfpI family protein [Candidatus Aenigmarchaeota archaeon]
MKNVLLLLVFSFLVLFSMCIIKEEKIGSEEYMKNVLFIIANKNFRDEEFEKPYQILSKVARVTIASSSLQEAIGMFGKRVKPNITIEDVDVNDYDAIIFVGGSGAKEYFDNKVALEIARKANENNKILAAICIAPVILARAGVLEGRNATVWNGEFIDELKKNGAIYTGKDVEIDGNIITANGPQAAEKFGKEIEKALR